MKKIILVLCVILITSVLNLEAQSFIKKTDHIINGYSKKVAGLDFDYHSCIPGLRESLLIRATTGKDYLEWETDPLTIDANKPYVAVIWITAIGSSPGMARMDLTTDENHQFVFYTDGKRSWSVDGNEGSSLSFHSIMTDQHGDNHGYMILRIPRAKVSNGKPLRIKVTGSPANLTSWYMTYRKQIKTGVTLNSFPAVIKQNDQLLQFVEAALFYFGDSAAASIYADNKLIASTTLVFGYNSVNLGLPRVSTPTPVKLKIVAGDFSNTTQVTLFPVKKWQVDLIQHSHTDIGYTRSQTEILAEHLRYIDYALDYCDATDNYPENAKFRWTCEASWPVDEYLKSRPAGQVERLLRRIKEGRIEVTGMYFNFDELPDEQILAASLKAVERIKSKGIQVNLAMQNDVNGIGWCMNDYFNLTGIKYLNMGTHGHRALICFDKPTMFWWESPSGKRVLTFRAEHYMTGNTVFELQSGDIVRFRNNLLNYLKNLESKQYPFSEIAIQHSGYLTDNSPPSITASDLIRQWNDIFEWPKLTTSSAEAFFRNMEKEHGPEFPVIRGAWPDWWTDGFGASARETSTTREAAASLLSNMGGLAMAATAGISIPPATINKISLANEALLFYTEHTAGYSESVREPLSLPTMEQRALKESYAWEANRRVASLGEDVMGLLQSNFSRDKEPSLIVFNTLNWTRSGPVTIYIDHQIVPRDKTAGVFDREGVRSPAQALSSRSDGTYWLVWLQDIPAFGYKKFYLRPVEEENYQINENPDLILENQWYKIVPDRSRGTIKSLYDKELSLEFADPASQYGLAEFILEKLANRSQMESRRLDAFTRLPLDTVWFDSMIRGDVFNSIKFRGETETAEKPGGFTIEFRLYNTIKRIDINCSIIKKSIFEPESFYIAFPFNLEEGKHYTELQGGVIETGVDQITGSANDWYTVQNFTSIRNSKAQVVIGCGEMPLMQFGAINTGRYNAGAFPQSTCLFSWPMNNYWVTNFNADQRGGHEWSYYMTSAADISNTFSTKFGWGCRIPFLTRILPGEGCGDIKNEGSFISGWPDNIIVISSVPNADGKSIIAHVRETEGKSARLELLNNLTGKQLTVREADIAGQLVNRPENVINPLESKFFRIDL
ncbi:MAG: glycosyl hydrolase family 38 [Bacteroidota bacterium]